MKRSQKRSKYKVTEKKEQLANRMLIMSGIKDLVLVLISLLTLLLNR